MVMVAKNYSLILFYTGAKNILYGEYKLVFIALQHIFYCVCLI